MRTPTIAASCLALAVTTHAAPPASVPQTPGVPPVVTARAANLVPIAPRMTKGTISVRNTGSAVAGPFKITVKCNVVGRTGGCAEPPERAVAAYEDPAFPNKLTVTAPGLSPGQVFNHKISFWDGVVWPSGNYEFTVVADAAGAVAETNESDNSGGTVMGVP